MSKTAILSFSLWFSKTLASIGLEHLFNKNENQKIIDRNFQKRISEVSKELEQKHDGILGNSFDYFFKSKPVFNELCKLLFVDTEINQTVIENEFDTSTLPPNIIVEFVASLRHKLNQDPAFQPLLANKEIVKKLSSLNDSAENIQHYTQKSYKELEEIKEIIENEVHKEDVNFDLFLSSYRANLINNLSSINFIGLGVDPSIKKGKRKDMDKLFVKPIFEFSKNSLITLRPKFFIEEGDVSLEYLDIFYHHDNYVILGNPGSGKSLLIKHLVCNIAKQNKEEFKNEIVTNHIPFRVELKEYYNHKKQNGGNILQYLSHSLDKEFCITVPPIFLDSLLNTKDVVLFFDGLDEIFNIKDKIEIKNDIENFHNLYNNIKSITTSRFIGYNEVKLDETRFVELKILPFNASQIDEYISKWYQLEEDNLSIRESEIGDCSNKMSNISHELKSNPLLLSLIVILYRNNLKIPDSRLEIYQSCTNTLVDKWDAIKGLKIDIEESIKERKEAILSDIAYWQYEYLSSKKPDITYSRVKSVVADSLMKKKIADEYNCERLAESFLEYAQNRSIYFDNNFTHKTFLEYYAAYWIYSNIEKKHLIEQRDQLLHKYINSSYWFIVLELLMNLIDKDQPDTDIIDKIFEKQAEKDDSLPFLLYILPKMKNISNDMIKLIYKKSITHLLNQKPNPENLSKLSRSVYNGIGENLDYDEHEIYIKETLNAVDRDKQTNLFYILTYEIFSPFRTSKRYKLSEILSFIDMSIIEQNPLTYRQYSNYEFTDHIGNAKRLIELYGVPELFKEQSGVFNQYYYSSALNSLLISIINSDDPEKMVDTSLFILDVIDLTTIYNKIKDGGERYWIYRESADRSYQALRDSINIAMENQNPSIPLLLIFLYALVSRSHQKEDTSYSIYIPSMNIPDKAKVFLKKVQNFSLDNKYKHFEKLMKVMLNPQYGMSLTD